MVLKNKRIGVAMTGSFCTYTKAFEQIDRLLEEGAILQTIFSDASQHIKCRFGKGEEFVKRAHDMTGNEPMKTIEEAEIIGRICMDQMMIDVTDIHKVKVGDVVTVIGGDVSQRIPAERVAMESDTITNELLSRLGDRLERLYL